VRDARSSARAALENVAGTALRLAEEALGDEGRPIDGRVHDARTAIKKVRALLRLVGPSAGKRARRAARRLRAAAHAMTPARDARVVLATLDAVIDTTRAAPSPSLAEARARLARRARVLSRAGESPRLLRRLREQLRREERRFPVLAARVSRREVRDGLVEGYRRARGAMDEARRGQTAAAFHAWRRRVKAHRHQLAALELGAGGKRLEELDHLARILGREHDLALLGHALATARALSPEDRRRLRAFIARRRAAYRARALGLGERAFAASPRAFARQAGLTSRRGGDP
jgi:CHAD domain-containing protein